VSFIENSLCYAGFENPCLYAFMRYHVYDANHSLVVDSFLQTKQEYPNFFWRYGAKYSKNIPKVCF